MSSDILALNKKHPIQRQIVESFVETIRYTDTIGENVNRAAPEITGPLPFITVYLAGDQKQQSSHHLVQSLLKIKMDINVKAYSYDYVEDELMQIRAEIYEAIRSKYDLGNSHVIDCNESDVLEPELSSKHETPRASQIIYYDVLYSYTQNKMFI